MISDLLFVSIAIFGTLVGSITDLKERIVPNWISYLMIIFGLTGHLLLSILSRGFWPLLNSLIGAGVFFGIASIMFYTGAWGGGDTKLLIGLGALLPVYPLALQSWLNPRLAIWPFMFTMWINVLIFGAIMGIGYGIYVLAKNWRRFSREIKQIIHNYKWYIHLITAMAAIPIALFFLKLEIYVLVGLIWIVCSVFFYTFIFTKSVENISMYKLISPQQLTEGDWIVEKVISNNKVLYRPERTGVTLNNIRKLINSGIRFVKIKEGLPMIPAFLVGLITSILFGDILFAIFTAVIP